MKKQLFTIMRSKIILILLSIAITASGQRSGKVLPIHSIHSGFFATTTGGHTGFFIDYQYYVDDVISYSIKPGVAWLSKNDSSKTTNATYFLFMGVNYRFNALRKPLRERLFNSQPYAGFYPLTFQYIDIEHVNVKDSDYRLGFVPSGIIGYTLIFMNRIDLDMHAGFGVSFRLGGKGGSPVEPVAFAGIGLGVRL
jgi:hypothetical protein